MAVQPVRLGPWPGGLNTRDAELLPDQLGPSQLRTLVNLDVNSAGALQARPGARRTGGPAMYTYLGASGTFWVLGSWELLGWRYAVIGVYNGIGSMRIYYSATPWLATDASWPQPAGNEQLAGAYGALVQYAGFAYLIPSALSPGTPTGLRRATLVSGTWGAVAGMPYGDIAMMIRERMFIVDRDQSRIYYSKPTDPTVWAAPDGGSFDVNPGDGERIYAAVVVNSQLYIFKGSRTYLFTFTADPALDGQVTLINDQLGGIDAQPWETGILVWNRQGVYRLVNNYFSRVDELAPALDQVGLADGFNNSRLSIEGEQLVLAGVGTTGFPYLHMAMNLRTGAWSQRIYPDTQVGPNTRYCTTRYDYASGNPPSTWNVYGHRKQTLSATPTAPGDARLRSTLDLTSASALISPRYRMVTGVMTGGDPYAYKRFYLAIAHVRNRLQAGDAAVQARIYVGAEDAGVLDMAMAVPLESAPVPVGTWGGKVALSDRRFLGLALELDKPQTTLSPTLTDPLTTSDFSVRGMLVRVDTTGGGERS